jgi:hypothetical protein
LSVATARSNMAFASAAVPDCWAIANPAHPNSINVANADANKLLLMAFLLIAVDMITRKRMPF